MTTNQHCGSRPIEEEMCKNIWDGENQRERRRAVPPVDGGSTDGGDGGVDPRPEHRHPPLGAVWRTQNHRFVLHQVSSTGHTGHRVRH